MKEDKGELHSASIYFIGLKSHPGRAKVRLDIRGAIGLCNGFR